MMIYFLGTVIMITVLFIWGNQHFKIKEITVISEKIPKEFDGYEILHVSDLHNTIYGRKNKRLSQAINKLNLDAIVYTGDLVDEGSFGERGFYDLLEGIEKNIPSFFSFGNHEDGLKPTQKEELLNKLTREEVTVLRDHHVFIEKDKEKISIYGLDLERTYLRDTYKEDGTLQLTKEELIKRFGEGREGFQILLAHNPLYGDVYMEAGFDLIFSGHVHGGMIRIPGIGGLLSPDRSFWPKYSLGKYESQGKALIVSPGIGGHKLRIGNSPYLYRVVLKSKLT